MESLKHNLSSYQADDDVLSTIKRARRMADLPPEVWELIFRNLSAYWLRSARLTCSTWNQIIRSSSRLMAKFVLTLKTENFQEDRKLVRNLLATGGGYTRAKIDLVRIGIHKPRDNWLKPLGMTLVTLSLEFSGTEILLTRVLKELPNLKQLNLVVRSHSFRSVVPNFRLEKLKELTFSYELLPNILTFLRWVCPQLTVLKLADIFIDRQNMGKSIAALVNATRRTLKELKIKVSQEIVDYLVRIEDLRLTRLAVDGNNDDILRFVKQQPDLEELDTLDCINISTLNGIISVLPNLKKLLVRIIEQDINQTWSLQKLSRIQTLTIRLEGWFTMSNNTLLNLIDCNLTNVRDLSLYRCQVTSQVLLDLQRTSVSRLTLKNCLLPRLSDLALLKSLNYVELENNEYLEQPNAGNKSSSSSVRSLKIGEAKQQELLAVAKLFPDLERFEGAGISFFGEDFFRTLSQHSPLLKELRFGKECYFSIRDAVVGFRALNTLSIWCKKKERKGCIEQLRDTNCNVAIEFN